MHTPLTRDQRGAVMVIALFMAMMMVGVLYYVVGIGDALSLRERMQDAADASAMSAAIVHARGMNIIALINIIMAAVLAILVMLKLISAAATAAIAVVIGISWIFPGALAALPPLKVARDGANTAAKAITPEVKAVLKSGNKLAHAVKAAVPVAAQAKVIDMAVNAYSPPVKFAFVLPIYKGLPVENDSFETLCGKAGEYAGEAISYPISKISGSDLVSDVMSSFTGKMAKTFAFYFCGKGGDLPEPTYKKQTVLPEANPVAAARCADDPAEHAASCQEVERDNAALRASIDDATGECRAPRKAECEARAQSARTQCRPGGRRGKPGKLVRWFWQQQTVRRVYTLSEDGRVVEGEPEVIKSTYVAPSRSDKDKGGSKTPPCKDVTQFGQVPQLWTDWNTNADEPLCHREFDRPTKLEFELAGKSELERTYDQVAEVLSCVVETKEKMDIDAEPIGGSDAESPQKLCGCTELDDPRFHLKAIVYGDASAALRRAREAVSVASWGEGDTRDTGAIASVLSTLGRVSFAQAEFYYSREDDEGRDEYLWHMRWRARMRRVRLTSPEPRRCPKPEQQRACPKPIVDGDCSKNEACKSGLPMLERLESLILH